MIRFSIKNIKIIGQFHSIRNHTTNTVNSEEIKFFGELSKNWWDELGPLKALHSYNYVRVPLIRDGLINSNRIDKKYQNTDQPFNNLEILDVGCGGGILTESLARLGGKLTGLDVGQDLIKIAKDHLPTVGLNNIEYFVETIENFSKNNLSKFDAVVASEVIEHVDNAEGFLQDCAKCVKPGGSIFITTFNKTFVSNFLGIFMAEDVLKVVPKGAHHYEKFIPPNKVQQLLENYNCKTTLVHGLFYNPFTNNWRFCKSDSLTYALQAIKL